MAHYAKVLDGKVVQVIVAEEEFMETFIDDSPGDWYQTSYNTHAGKHYDSNGIEDDGTPLRKNFAGVGFTYDEDRDAFIPPKTYDSWILNEDTCQYDPPNGYPSDWDENPFSYRWNEETQTWDAVTE